MELRDESFTGMTAEESMRMRKYYRDKAYRILEKFDFENRERLRHALHMLDKIYGSMSPAELLGLCMAAWKDEPKAERKECCAL